MFNTVEQNKNNFLKTAFMSFNNANDVNFDFSLSFCDFLRTKTNVHWRSIFQAWLELLTRHEEVQDERWLHHYMLGKIAEKKEEDITVALNHYFEVI